MSRIASTTLSPTGMRRTRRWVACRSSAVIAALGVAWCSPVVSMRMRRSAARSGVGHVDLHQEAVELRLGQRIGTLLLQRVLRRQHVKGRRKVVPLAGDRHVVLLHRLEQGGLGARAGAVDLVGHQQLGEDRSAHELEGPLAVDALLEDLRAEDVGRHEVGRELHAARVEAEHGAQRIDELGLGEAGHADEQAVAAGQQRDEHLLDDLRLAEDHRTDGGAGGGDPVERGFRGAGDGGFQSGGVSHGRSRARQRLVMLAFDMDEGLLGAYVSATNVTRR